MSLNALIDIYVLNEKLTRQTGKTTALIEACKKIGGIFVVYSHAHAQSLKQKYPDVHITTPSIFRLRGKYRPIIFDHYLLSLILLAKHDSFVANKTTEQLERELKCIREELLNRIINNPEIGVRLEG